MTLIFATHNSHKAMEIASQLPFSVELTTLSELDYHDEIPETGSTLEENARIKAEFVAKKFEENCFADDTGLEVEALNGEPGVYSARYSGEDKNSEANMDLLLKKLEGNENRNAQFKTIISLYWEGEFYQFEGVVKGKILKERKGNKGFGYDPIFQPDEANCSFAEMEMSEKSKISHRGRAIEKMLKFIKNN
jgi:XTP/dITP diphosphohydrolase|tara:strand:- start:606 stop:1181 length:576 start_codon:yes stop_codon:yes gene_type:complete